MKILMMSSNLSDDKEGNVDDDGVDDNDVSEWKQKSDEILKSSFHDWVATNWGFTEVGRATINIVEFTLCFELCSFTRR